MRILIHPGFHKTGTSSLQRGTQTCAKALAPLLRVWLTSNIILCTRAAQSYSKHGNADALARFAARFEQMLRNLDVTDTRPLLISSEDLSGAIPGLPQVKDYRAAPHLLATATGVIRQLLGGKADITIWFTTRDPDAWMRSVYWQNLRARRIITDYETYRPCLEAAARLDDIVNATVAQVGTSARVLSTPVEQCSAQPLGPLGVALDLLEIPTAGLPPLPAQNVQPAGGADQLLALNRSDISDTELLDAKRKIMRDLRHKGLTTRMTTKGTVSDE